LGAGRRISTVGVTRRAAIAPAFARSSEHVALNSAHPNSRCTDVEIPGLEPSGADRRLGGLRRSRPGESRRADRTGGDAPAARAASAPGRDPGDVASLGPRHMIEGAARLADVATGPAITDDETARATARDIRRRVHEDPRSAALAQAHVDPRAALRLVG
jgi:hypothetical protein